MAEHATPTVADVTASALRLKALLAQAEEVQWQPSHTPTPRDDTTERAKGGHGDPTFATVGDARRLAVRAAVIDTERLLSRMLRASAHAEAKLQHALDRWHGDDFLTE